MDIKTAEEERLLKRVKGEQDLIEKEIKSAESDLETSKTMLKQENYKWCIATSYYVAFHASRALMYSFDLKEIKHEGIRVFLEDRVKVGKLDSEFLHKFKALKSMRESANYEGTFSEERAKEALDMAEEFFDEIKSKLKL